ncbi:MAG: PhzF family phenazine biosynthesis protein [Nitrospira sp.]|nr:PhzF family phenazine biosynthesis protein [Nitrospira sp.]MCA9476277.1 PhzF family phenazine biosynthesis protein [Nitrospira sp.]MCA9481365.1 PhzF family phenazine biosynthesis protein [Nitrospira sp.]MCB9711186.1 PhzF family phenazine biosynthesis protein [Nitrospiraceae bacterium]MDR4486810.1 PhzF family phenazine biosynthesis protein [Nitrospirales bacterium]
MDPSRRWLQFYQADVFTDEPFGGNPLAVFPKAEDLSEREFQQIAREMNLSETVFVLPPTDPQAAAKLRIFTPTREIPFAGHPVLGTFYILGVLKLIDLQEPMTKIFYECNLGVFPLEVIVLKGQIEQVIMSQPHPEFLESVTSAEAVYEVAKALGLSKTLILDQLFPLEIVSTGLPVLIVPLKSLTAVKSIEVNHSLILEVCSRWGVNGILAFSSMTVEENASVHARMFADPIGIPEDPATGSAGGALGAYLVKNGVVEVGPTTEVVIEQGYEIDRPSRILVQVFSDDDTIKSVKVGGQVVMVAEGKVMC